MINDVIVQLDKGLEEFLRRWSEYLRQAGYFELAFARRDDSIKAFSELLAALKSFASEETPSLKKNIDRNCEHIDFFVGETRKQRARGGSAEMSVGFLKAMRMAVEDLIGAMVLLDSVKLRVLELVRRYYDAVEVVVVRDWEETGDDRALEELKLSNLELARDKNTYESIFETTSNIVLITDGEGKILKANPEAWVFFFGKELINQYCGEILGLPGTEFSELLKQKPPNQVHETTLKVGEITRVFSLQIKPLSQVSISLPGMMLILSDITYIVDRREMLERSVTERTSALSKSEKMTNSIFQSVGKGILLLDEDGEVVKANQKASEIYGVPLEVLVGASIGSLMAPQGYVEVDKICQGIVEGQRQSVEVSSIYVDGKTFPSDIVITRMDIDGQLFWPLIVRDITEQRAMEDGLREEKLQSEEMNVTLRNVLRSIENDRLEAEESLTRRVRSSLLPGLEKVRKERSVSIRASYLDLIREQLVSLTAGFETELDADLLKLSKTELKVCRFIKSGLTGKEICDIMNLSFETIQTHRKNIRKKLGLSGKTVNLHTFLANRNVELGGLDVK